MNEKHYVSRGIAKKLGDAGIEFPESEKVWSRYKIQVKDSFEWSDWYLTKKDFRDDLEGELFSEYVVRLNAIPAPSLSEILDELGDAYGTFGKGTCVNWDTIDDEETHIHAETRANAAALMRLKVRGGEG